MAMSIPLRTMTPSQLSEAVDTSQTRTIERLHRSRESPDYAIRRAILHLDENYRISAPSMSALNHYSSLITWFMENLRTMGI